MGDLATLPTFQAAPTGYSHTDFNAVFAALTIANGAVSTNKLADGAVTFQKMANVATQTLLGRSTAATGVVEAITLGAGLVLAATVLSVGWLDSDSSHRMRIACGSDLTADRTITITPGDAARTITLSGNPTLADWFDQSVKSGASPTFAATNFTGTSGITGTGALNSGSITSGFGAIDVGADAISGGAISGTTLTTTGATSSLATGTAGTFTTSDVNSYPRISLPSASAQLGLFRSTTSVGGVYIGGDSTGFGVYSDAFVNWMKVTSTGLNSTVIGATTPAAGSFTTLGATATVTTSKATGGQSRSVASLNTTGIYDSYGTSAGTKAYIGTGDQIIGGGSVNDFGLDSVSGDIILLTAEVVRGRFSSAGLAVTPSTASTSTITGALVVTGGVGIGGAVWIGGVCNALSFNTTSARRFKTNIHALAGADDLLWSLRPVSYDEARLGGRTGLPGLIAEEVEPILPSLVSRDAEGRVSGLNYAQVVSPLIAGWQHHDERLHDHERRLAALETTPHGKN